MMDSSTFEYEEYYAEDHQVDEFPPEQPAEESDGVSGFFDSLNTIKTGIVDSLHMPEENETVKSGQEEKAENEDKGLFETLTGFELPSPFSHSEENGEEHIELVQQEEEKEEKKRKSSLLNKLTTRFDGKKEKGYDVKSSSAQDNTELKDAPKVSNMVKMFEGFAGKQDNAKTSESKGLAEEEIAAEKRKALEKSKSEEGGLLDKLSSFSLTSGDTHSQEGQDEHNIDSKPEESKGLIDSFMDSFSTSEEMKPEEINTSERKAENKRGLMDRLAASFSFDSGDAPLPAEPEEMHEVDEASEPSILDQIVHTITGEPEEVAKPVEHYD